MLVKTKAGVTVRAFRLQSARISNWSNQPFGRLTDEENEFLKIQGALRNMIAVTYFNQPDDGWCLTYQSENGEVSLKAGDAIIFDEHNAIHPIKKNLFELLFEPVREET